MNEPATCLPLKAFRVDANLQEMQKEAQRLANNLGVIVALSYCSNTYHLYPEGEVVMQPPTAPTR